MTDVTALDLDESARASRQGLNWWSLVYRISVVTPLSRWSNDGILCCLSQVCIQLLLTLWATKRSLHAFWGQDFRHLRITCHSVSDGDDRKQLRLLLSKAVDSTFLPQPSQHSAHAHEQYKRKTLDSRILYRSTHNHYPLFKRMGTLKTKETTKGHECLNDPLKG